MDKKLKKILTIATIVLFELVGLSQNSVKGQSTYDCDRFARDYARRNARGGVIGGAARGAVKGAILGAIFGGRGGAGDGAAFGAVIGGVGGGTRRAQNEDYLYNRAYNDCIRGGRRRY